MAKCPHGLMCGDTSPCIYCEAKRLRAEVERLRGEHMQWERDFASQNERMHEAEAEVERLREITQLQAAETVAGIRDNNRLRSKRDHHRETLRGLDTEDLRDGTYNWLRDREPWLFEREK